jgi:hypothetical protein
MFMVRSSRAMWGETGREMNVGEAVERPREIIVAIADVVRHGLAKKPRGSVVRVRPEIP